MRRVPHQVRWTIVLSHDERREIELIGKVMSVEDPRFADKLRTGAPRRPQEYRRWPAALLICFGVACLLLAAVSSNWLPAVIGAATLPAGGWVWPSRRLDRPPGVARRRRRRRSE